MNYEKKQKWVPFLWNTVYYWNRSDYLALWRCFVLLKISENNPLSLAPSLYSSVRWASCSLFWMWLHIKGIRRSMLWPHNISAREAALVSSLASGGFQDGHPGLLITVRHGSSLPGRRLLAGLQRRSLSELCVLPAQGHVLSDGPTAALETEALLLWVWGCGTIFWLILDKLTLALNSLNGYWNIFVWSLRARCIMTNS